MAIKLVHESLEPLTEPEIFEIGLDLVQLMRTKKVTGIAIAYVIDRQEDPREYLQLLNDDCDPENMMQNILDLGKELIDEYDLEDFRPGEI